jgi:hypothetical protein
MSNDGKLMRRLSALLLFLLLFASFGCEREEPKPANPPTNPPPKVPTPQAQF